MKFKLLVLFSFILLISHSAWSHIGTKSLFAQDNRTQLQHLFRTHQKPQNSLAISQVANEPAPCKENRAGEFPCANINLLSNLTLEDLAAQEGNDIWGWTDQASGREFALIGLNNGLAFIEVSDPSNPLYLGKLPPHGDNSIWRDVKVYKDHAFTVSEAPGHGLQIFNLEQLLTVNQPPITFMETEHYDGFGNAHNIAINEASGFAYVAGTLNTCNGGLHMIDIQEPTNPLFAGCVSQDGYTHDTQCVIYNGPDQRYQDHEICFNANEDTLTIVDVSDKENPQQIKRLGYPGVSYAHQGWLTADQRYFLMGDELDEIFNGHNSRTYIWDLADLQDPQVIGIYTAPLTAIDHNIYIHKGLVYEANYRSGLRILNGAQIPSGKLNEIAYFDTYPSNNAPNFNGAWSVYPFFESGTIIVSDIDRGLFVLRYSPQLFIPVIGR